MFLWSYTSAPGGVPGCMVVVEMPGVQPNKSSEKDIMLMHGTMNEAFCKKILIEERRLNYT